MRYIDFKLPGNNQNVLVHMEETPSGAISITLKIDGKPADIRGLFFDVNDAALIPHLSVGGADVTSAKFKDEGVMDLGNGVNMNGGGRGPFDVGVAFGSAGNGKDMIGNTTLLLRSAIGGLTLDDLALVDFGIRLTGGGSPPKMVVTAPAAPNAIDDNLSAVEDTQIVYSVLANDTDADGIADFKIVSVTDPVHGTATISADGKTIIYLPDDDYSGPDSFTYAMIDGHGGGDSATATIGVIAVADAPTLSVTTAAGATVNQILVTVSSTVTDNDGSEYLDRFEFSGLPAGASIVGESDLVYNPTSTGQTLSQTFTLQLAPNTDFNFNLGVTAVAKESSNGDEEATSKSVAVLIDSNSNSFAMTFQATDQSIWGSGNAFNFVDDRFLGFTLDPPEASTGGFIFGKADLYVKSGLQSTLTFNGGSIDATVPVDVLINTTYNHLTDILLIQSNNALKSGGVSFATDGPSGSYILDLIFDYAVSASLNIDFGAYEPELFSFSDSGNNRINLLTFDSEDISYTFDLGFGLSITLAWPNVDSVSGNVTSGRTFTSSGTSNNFLTVGVDVDDALASILKIPNPFDIGIDIGVAWGNAEALDVDLSAGMNFIQEFLLTIGNLTGVLTFENGSTRAWDFSDIVITGASAYDQDVDGIIEFSLLLDQAATLTNDTDLGFNFGYNIDLLKASGGYDYLVDSGDWSVGPVYRTGETFPLGSVSIYDATFALDLAAQTISFAGNDTLLG